MADKSNDRDLVNPTALALTVLANGRTHAARLLQGVHSHVLRGELIDRAAADVARAVQATGPRGAAGWLLDHPPPPPPPAPTPTDLAGQARALYEAGESVKAIARDLEASESTVRRWIA